MSWKIKVKIDSLLCPYFRFGGCTNPDVNSRYCSKEKCTEKIIGGDE